MKLDDFCEFINGGAWSDKEYVSDGIPVVKVTNMVNGTIINDVSSFLPQNCFDKYKKHILSHGDLVVTTVGSHPTQPGSVVGRTAVIPKEFDGAFLNQNAVCIRVKREDLVSPEFLRHLAKTAYFKSYIESRARGSANQVRMAIGELKKFHFNYPSLPVQKKIAAILSAYDDLIENNNKRIALLEKAAEEIYREWFVRMRFPGWEQVKFVKGIPVGWGIVELEKIAKFTMGQSPKSEFYNEVGDGLPFHQGVGTYGERFPENKIFCSVSGRMAKKGDILFSVRAPVGRLNIANCDLIIGRGLAAMNHKENKNSYLFYLLQSQFAKEDVIGNGAIFASVSKDELKKFKILSPAKHLIDSFDKIASKLDNQIENLYASNSKLTKSHDLLLARLISGKLPVEALDIRFPPSMVEGSAG